MVLQLNQAFENYKVIKKVIEGKTAILYKAIDIYNKMEVMIKILTYQAAQNRTYRKQINREARIGRKLDHPNVIRVYKSGMYFTQPYFVMEFFPGQNLKIKILHRDALCDEEAGSIIKQIAEGLAYIHSKGIVHKDIKPENILVNSAGMIKICDFALAEDITKKWRRLFRFRKAIRGTRAYMSPEQIRGHKLDFKTDIYSFGATIYEILAKRPPFTSSDQDLILQQHLTARPKPIWKYNPNVSVRFDQFVSEMLAKNPRHRPANMEKILERLAQIPIYKE